jgi:hypothetical protein
MNLLPILNRAIQKFLLINEILKIRNIQDLKYQIIISMPDVVEMIGLYIFMTKHLASISDLIARISFCNYKFINGITFPDKTIDLFNFENDIEYVNMFEFDVYLSCIYSNIYNQINLFEVAEYGGASININIESNFLSENVVKVNGNFQFANELFEIPNVSTNKANYNVKMHIPKEKRDMFVGFLQILKNRYELNTLDFHQVNEICYRKYKARITNPDKFDPIFSWLIYDMIQPLSKTLDIEIKIEKILK